jgi:Na+/proline symporter
MPEDMSPLTAPGRTLKPWMWRVMLLLACVLVFSFALHAKLGVYASGSRLDPSVASKLWTNDAKWQPSPVVPTGTLIWLAVFLSSLLCIHQVRRYVTAEAAIVCEQYRHQYLHRFLRPPPTR